MDSVIQIQGNWGMEREIIRVLFLPIPHPAKNINISLKSICLLLKGPAQQ